MTLKRKGPNTLFFGAVAGCSLLLSACGGSGSDEVSVSPVTYTGVTTAAAVDNDAAAVKYSETAVSGSAPSSVLLMGVSAESGELGTSYIERLRSFADSVMGMDYTSMASVTVAGATVNEVEQGCAGSASGTLNYDDLNGNSAYDEVYDRLLSASVTYSNYKARSNDGSCSTITSNGSATITFLYDNPYNDLDATGMAVSTPALATTDTAGVTETLTGSFTISMLYPELSLMMSVDYQRANGLVYRMKDYRAVFSVLDGITSVDGILCDPAEGCIEIVTAPTFSYDSVCAHPISGTVTIYGYDWNTKERTLGYITVDAGNDAGGCSTYQACWTGAATACLVPDPAW